MKRIFLLLSAILLISVCSSGQWYNNYYPDRQLSDLNNSELQILNKKATALRNTGMGISITGAVVGGSAVTVIFFSGLIDFFAWISTGQGTVNPSVYDVSLGFMFVGLGVMLVGYPILITGSLRMREIKKCPNFRDTKSTYSLIPSIRYLNEQNKVIPGITIKFRF